MDPQHWLTVIQTAADLGRGRAAGARAGEVEWAALGGGGCGGQHPRRRGLEQHRQADLLGVEEGAAAGGLHHAAEVAVVPVVGRVLNAEVVASQRREPFDPVKEKRRWNRIG